LDGDFAEGGLEGEGARPSALDAIAPLTAPLLEDEFSVGLLDEDLEEPTLELEAGLMDEGLDLFGEVLVLEGHGQGHLQLEVDREGLTLAVDGTESDGSLEVVGLTHGEAP
jgi:hypothetical protein